MEKERKILTFINNNGNLEFYSEDPGIEWSLESLGYTIYHSFELDAVDKKKLYDEFRNVIMETNEYILYKETGIGVVHLNSHIFAYTKYIDDINEKEYNILPSKYKEEYIVYMFDDAFTRDELRYIVENIEWGVIFNSSVNRLRDIISDYI